MAAEVLDAPGAGALEVADGADGPELFRDPDRFGVLAFLGTVSMMFIGFTSAYIVRRTGADWQPMAAPPLLWLNTAVLLASSVTLERSRSLARAGTGAASAWLLATGALGAAFVAGQYGLWQTLSEQGVYLSSNPHNSFFYMLTGLHIVHLLGGLGWFARTLFRSGQRPAGATTDVARLFAIYWHFLGGLWVYLLLLLFVF
jgi:cytochrome c oxidase subunit 3